MAVIRYTKQYTSTASILRKRMLYDKKQRRIKQRFALLHRIAPFFLMGVGIVLLGSVVWPVLSYEFFSSPTLRANATDQRTSAQVIPKMVTKEYLFPTPQPTPIVVASELDYINLSDWFPDRSLPIVAPSEAKSYTLSIPKVGIVDAEVMLGDTNLDHHLIQYPGTANPGEYGSPVIFGHSVLRQFYNPAINNPRRYISIFSKIMMLENGDEIVIKEGNVTYRYQVSDKTEVKPEDLYILDQNRSLRQLKLVTCVPEGTTLRRGIVTAILEQVEQ